VQFSPIKSTLKSPGTKRLKLKYVAPLSKLAFKINLRRYKEEVGKARAAKDRAVEEARYLKAGAYTHSRQSST